MKDLSVLLVDHNPLFAQLLTRFLQSEEHVHVVGAATRDYQALARALELSPEIVLIDLDASVKESLDAIRRIHKTLPDCLIIAMTMMDMVYYRKAVLDAGADDLFLKTDIGANFLVYLHANLEKRKRGKLKAIAPVLAGFPKFAETVKPA